MNRIPLKVSEGRCFALGSDRGLEIAVILHLMDQCDISVEDAAK
jgi:hypothetical protein